MSMLTNWIKRHQITAFFTLSYAITWPLLILVYFVFPGNQIVGLLVGPFAVFSPALAAMWISFIIEPQPKTQSSKPRSMAFAVSWLISMLIIASYMWYVNKLELIAAIVAGVIWALFPSWILSSAFARTPGIRKLFSTLLRPRGNLIWYLVALFGFPAIQLLGAGIAWLLGGEVGLRLDGMSLGSAAIVLALTFLNGFLFAGGINEESGWRGFALPRLQRRYPVIVAIGIVWLFWAFWHLPYDIGMDTPIDSLLRNRILYNLLWSIYFAWVYNRTRGSMLAPALFHPSMNTFGDNLGRWLQLPDTPITTYLFVALAVFAILYDRMWKKLPPDDPAVYRSP